MNECLCCSHRLLRHIQRNRLYWYCSNCRQEMPNPTAFQTQPTIPSPTVRSLRDLLTIS